MASEGTEGPSAEAARAAAADRVPGWLLAAMLAVPLVYVPTWFVFPFVATKVWLLRPVAWAAAAWLAGSWLLRGARFRRPGPVACAGLVWLASAALSSAAGVDPERSVWDTAERMIGFVTLAAVAVVFATAMRVGRRPDAWLPVLRVALSVACLVALGALLQAAGIVGLGVHTRASSTVGSPAYLGAFGLHGAFLGFLVLALSGRRTDRVLAWTSVVMGLAALVCSEARSAVLGLVLGGAYAAFDAAKRATPRIRRAMWTGAAALASLAGLAAAFPESAAVRAIPLVRRFLSSEFTGSTTGTRLLAWDVALDAARDRPVLGWGPNCFQYAHAAHYRPEFLRWGTAETFFDDAHGVVFGTLAEQGLVGLAALVALYAAAFVALRRARAMGQFPAAACAAAGAWLLAHVGNLLVSFEDVSSLVVLALVLAFCESAAPGPAASAAAPSRDRRGLRVAGAVACALAAVAWTAYADVRPAVANAKARRAMDEIRGAPLAAIEGMRASVDVGSPHAATDAAVFAWLAHRTQPALAEEGRADEAEVLGASAFDVLGEVSAGRPLDVQRVLLRASLASDTPALRGDAGATAAVRDELIRATAAAPLRQDLRFALAALEFRTGRFQEAADAIQAVVRTDPDGSEGLARLAAVYSAAGRDEEARRIVREARARGVEFRGEDARLIEGLLE